MSDIFLSYSRSNRDTVRRLAHALERRGWSLFWDYDIRTAEDFEKRIKSEAESASCIVVVWSQASVESEWVAREASIGLNRKVLLPALIEKATLPGRFAKLNAADLTNWSSDTPHEGFQTLLEDIARVIGRPEPGKRRAFEMALRNIARYGDTDVLPYPIEKSVFNENRRESLELLQRMDVKYEWFKKSHRPFYESSLYPVGFFGFRWVTQIDPVWNAYMLGLVAAIGGQIEAARSRIEKGTVFSYRFKPNQKTGALFDDKIGWTQYQERSLVLAKEFEQVVVCDIADFYARVSHSHVRLALRKTGAAPEVIERIVDLLGVFSGGEPYGLPIGGPAARLLSELVLHSVDSLLATEGVTFCRFADDYHVFAKDERHAYQQLMLLSERLFGRLGLTLQKSKTRLMSAKELMATTRAALAQGGRSEEGPDENIRWSLLKLQLKFHPYNEDGEIDLEGAKERYEELRRAIDEYDLLGILARELTKSRPDPALTRRLIDAVRFLDPENRNIAVRALLSHKTLEKLYPLLSNLLRTFQFLVSPEAYGDDQFPEDADEDSREVVPYGPGSGLEESVRREVFDKLADLIDSGSYLMGIPAYLSYAVRSLTHDLRSSTDRVLAEAYKNSSGSSMVRRDIILAMAQRRNEEWIRLLFKQEQGLTAWERRALLIASTVLGSEGRTLRQRMEDSASPMDILAVEWAERGADAIGPR